MTQEEVRLKCVELAVRVLDDYNIGDTPTATVLEYAKEIENYVSEPTNRRMIEVFDSMLAEEREAWLESCAKSEDVLVFGGKADKILKPIADFLSKK